MYTPKGYRISKFYGLLFESIYNVLGKDKLNLAFALLQNKKHIDVKRIKELPSYNKNNLMEQMIDLVRNDNRDIYTLFHYLDHDKINKIKKSVKSTSICKEAPRETFMIRILPEYAEFVTSYSKEKHIAETIELIIAYFVVQQTEEIYELITEVFKYLANEADSE